MAKKKKKNVLKAAIYIRVSTVEPSDNDFSSLDGQESQCRTSPCSQAPASMYP